MRAHEQVASEQMARLEKQDVVMAVTRVIGELLDSGQVSLESVAERLEITARTLRSRLAEAETSFNQLLASYRSNLARRLLARTDESIDEIVYLTGFSEPSTFYRAFKRWTGLTPIEYRRRVKNANAPQQEKSISKNEPSGGSAGLKPSAGLSPYDKPVVGPLYPSRCRLPFCSMVFNIALLSPRLDRSTSCRTIFWVTSPPAPDG